AQHRVVALRGDAANIRKIGRRERAAGQEPGGADDRVPGQVVLAELQQYQRRHPISRIILAAPHWNLEQVECRDRYLVDQRLHDGTDKRGVRLDRRATLRLDQMNRRRRCKLLDLIDELVADNGDTAALIAIIGLPAFVEFDGELLPVLELER